MITATEARAKVEAIKAAEMADLQRRAEELCECYNRDISNAINRKDTEAIINHIPLKLVKNVIEVFKSNGYEVEETLDETQIVVKW